MSSLVIESSSVLWCESEAARQKKKPECLRDSGSKGLPVGTPDSLNDSRKAAVQSINTYGAVLFLPRFFRERANKMATTRTVGRDAKTGLFVPIKETVRRPDTTVKERITVPSPGTKRSK